jgi:hypothetical protein
MADEVDVESNGALRSLWLELHGVDKAVPAPAHNFPTTRLVWTPGKKNKPTPKIGLHLGNMPNSDVGMRIDNAVGAALKERIVHRDILLEVNGKPIRKKDDIKKALEGFEFGKEVRLLLVREVKESEVERMKKFEAFYLKRAAERTQLRADGKPVPDGFMDYVEEEDESEDEGEDDGCSSIDLGDDDDDDDDDDGGSSEKTVMVAFERVVQLRRPEVDNIVRDSFGAQWDRGYPHKGVKVKGVIAGTRAALAGFKDGDVIIAAGSDPVDKRADLRKYFEGFKFEKAPEGERFVEFTVLRGGKAGEEATIRVDWDPVQAARVDVKFHKKDNEMRVLVRHVSKFTVYLDEDLVPAGQPFHIFINGIPYLDLVEGKAPDYPKVTPGSDSHQAEQRRTAMRKRAKHPGWQPDIKWAVENALKWRDRGLVVGNKLEFDLSAMKAGFEGSNKRRTGRRGERAGRIKKAYEEYKSKG